jgi:DNA repair ATPase RecN|tara:strand:- start:485 stop:1150 length:666 start_codon:yes stop_codon:yes gene_type:complete
MPCTKCKEGKYKWGKTGSCEYDTKEECEKANPKNYNKMRPTPLGKKSYEEYEKELKEYNLSTQRFDFNDVKTIEKLASQLESVTEKLDKEFGDIEDLAFKARKEEELKNEAIDLSAETKKETDKIKADADKRLENLLKQSKKTFQDWQKSEGNLEKANNSYKSNYNKGEALKNKLNSAIKEVQAQIKALGLKDKPKALQDGEWSVEEFDKQVPDAAKYFKR